MTNRKRKIIGLLATTVAVAAGPGAGSAMANWSLSGAETTEGGNLAFTVNANCENGIFPCIDEKFSYSVDSGTAHVEADLPATSSNVLLSAIPWGNNTRVIEIPTTDDDIDEPNAETVTFTVTHSGKFGSATRTATGTILDNDPEPQVNSVTAPATVNEGTGIERTVPFVIHLAKASEQSLTRSYSTQDGTAKAGSDYVATSGNVTFAPGETEKTVNVPLMTDSTHEADETFSLVSGSGSATVKILDDDAAPDTGNQNPGNQNPGNNNPGNQAPSNNGTQQSSNAGPQIIYVPSSTGAKTTPAKPKKKAAKKCRKGTVAKKGKNKKVTCVKKAKKRGKKSRK